MRGVAAAAYAAEFALPWAATGHRVRSGYNLAGVLHQTRIVPNRYVGAVVFCVLAMPVLAALTIALELVGAARVAIVSLVVTSVLVAACAFAVGFARVGPRVALGTVVAVAVLLVVRPRRLGDVGGDGRTSADD
jgi:hypothetical protein